MATETVKIVFDPILGARAQKKVVSESERLGEKAGSNFGDGFNSKSRRGISRVGSAIARLGPIAAAAATALAGVIGTREAIQAAARQQEAVNNLNSSLARIGELSKSTSQDLQDFASELQKTTRFGDEAVLEQLAFAQGLGATAEQSKEVVAAAADLSAALNIDLNSATRNIARTLGGFAGELGEVIPELKNLTAEQLRAGEAIGLLGNQFRGLATAQIRTFNGAIDQAGNAFGDFLESIGAFVTESPSIVGALRGISLNLAGASSNIKNTAESLDLFRGPFLFLTRSLAAIGPALITVFTGASRGFGAFVNAVGVGANFILASFAEIGGAAAKLAEALGLDGELTESLLEFRDITRNQVSTSAQELSDRLSSLGDPINTEGFLDSLLTIEEQIKASNERIAESGGLGGVSSGVEGEEGGLNKAVEEDTTTIKNLFQELGSAITATEAEIKNKLAGVSKAAAKLGQDIKRSIGQGLGGAFAAFGNALASGENALDAFAKSFLGTLGQLMVQQGTAFILQGLGFQVIPGLQGNGATLIGVGAALATFGGVLTALGGQSAQTASASATGGGVGATGTNQGGEFGSTVDQVEQREAPQTGVNLTIQGDVLDSEDTGLRIVEVLNQAFDQQGVVINNPRFA